MSDGNVHILVEPRYSKSTNASPLRTVRHLVAAPRVMPSMSARTCRA